ncbi:MAG: hypothetical protein EOO65_00790 [Methanosarcinales archaeon]|nr:MAG: hypothetical protein EOO65_00790 [Methanosarcinales archaeon]
MQMDSPGLAAGGRSASLSDLSHDELIKAVEKARQRAKLIDERRMALLEERAEVIAFLQDIHLLERRMFEDDGADATAPLKVPVGALASEFMHEQWARLRAELARLPASEDATAVAIASSTATVSSGDADGMIADDTHDARAAAHIADLTAQLDKARNDYAAVIGKAQRVVEKCKELQTQNALLQEQEKTSTAALAAAQQEIDRLRQQLAACEMAAQGTDKVQQQLETAYAMLAAARKDASDSHAAAVAESHKRTRQLEQVSAACAGLVATLRASVSHREKCEARASLSALEELAEVRDTREIEVSLRTVLDTALEFCHTPRELAASGDVHSEKSAARSFEAIALENANARIAQLEAYQQNMTMRLQAMVQRRSAALDHISEAWQARSSMSDILQQVADERDRLLEANSDLQEQIQQSKAAELTLAAQLEESHRLLQEVQATAKRAGTSEREETRVDNTTEFALQSEIDRLTRACATLEQEKAVLKGKAEKLVIKFKATLEDLSNARQQLVDVSAAETSLKEQLQTLTAARDASADALSGAEACASSSAAPRDASADALSGAEACASSSAARIAALEAEVASLTAARDASADALSGAEACASSSAARIAALEAEVASLTAERESLLDQVRSIHAVLERTEADFASSHSSLRVDYEAALADVVAARLRVDAAQAMSRAAEDRTAEATKVLEDELAAALRGKAELDSEVTALKAQISSLSSLSCAAAEKEKKYEAQLEELAQRLVQAEEQAGVHVREAHEAERAKAGDAAAKHEAALAAKVAELSALQRRFGELQQRTHKVETELERARAHIDVLNGELATAEASCSSLRAECDGRNSSYEALHSELAAKSKLVEALYRQIAELETSLRDVAAEKSVAGSTTQSLEAELASVSAQMKTLRSTIEARDAHIAQLTLDVEANVNARTKTTARAREKLKALGVQHEEQITAIRNDFQAQLDALCLERDELTAQLDDARSRCAAAEANATSARAEQIAVLQAQLDEAHETARTLQRQMTRQLTTVRKEADEALRCLGERDSELRIERQSASTQIASLVAERDALARRIAALQGALDAERSRVASAEEAATASAHKAMAVRVARMEEARQADKSIIAEVRRAAADEVALLKQQLCDEQRRCADADTRASSAVAAMSTLQSTIMSLRGQLRDAMSQVEAGKVQLQQMVAQMSRVHR